MSNPQSHSLTSLTEEIAINSIRDFFRDKPFVFLGSGMSCALDDRFGMPALQKHLSNNIVPDAQASDQVQQWEQVQKSLQDGMDLESALDSVTDLYLLQKITEATGKFLASIDRDYALKIANGDISWPATLFFKRLVDTLPEGDRVLHVLTPNYDMLFEYACDSVDIHYINGFAGGVQRKCDWHAVERSLLVPELVCIKNRFKTLHKQKKHVRIYKVHGSLSFFFHQNAVVENNSWTWDPPGFSVRVMVTPGLSKYQTLHSYRQELLKHADAAIEKANRFLFLGYGFNDKHLEEYVKRKLVAQQCKGLIITRDPNRRIDCLLAEASNVWLVCKKQEVGSDGTLIRNNRYPEELYLPSKRFWEIGEFTKLLLGG